MVYKFGQPMKPRYNACPHPDSSNINLNGSFTSSHGRIMALARAAMCLILMVVLAAEPWDRVTAQPGCPPTLSSLAPCFGFIMGNSSTPSASCCSALSMVVQSSPRCLCSALNGRLPSLGINTNQTQALQLPGACNIRTPPVSQCNGIYPIRSTSLRS